MKVIQSNVVVAVQSLSCVQLLVTLWTAACQGPLSFTVAQSLLKFMSIESWCHPSISSSVAPCSPCPQSFPDAAAAKSLQSCPTLLPHELQHARPPCPSPTLGVYPSSWPLSRWCHPAISSSVIPFSPCPQFFPAAGAAKSLQSCPTVCNPIDGSPPGSPHPWDFPGKNTGVSWHFLLQCTKVKSESESEVLQSCPTLSWPHRLQPTRLLHPWDFPGKSTRVGWHCLLWSFPALGFFFSNDYLFASIGQKESELQHQSIQWIFSVDFL